MTEHLVQGYRLGRGKPDRRRPVLNLADFLVTVPDHPLVADHLSLVTAWNGATNTRFGTCGPVSFANYVIMVWKYLLGLDITVSDNAIFDLYRRSGNPGFDPATGAGDKGVDMSVMLSAILSGGLEITHSDGGLETVKAIGFGSVPLRPSGIDMIHASTSIFGGVLFGLDLEVAQQGQTSTGLWDYTPSADWGGHATMGGAYTSSAAAGTADETCITWQQPVGMTDDFIAHQDSECFGVILQPHLDHPGFQDALDVAAFAAAYTAITGNAFPGPVPPAPPQPGPVPPAPAPPGPPPTPPAPDQALAAWAAVARPWVNGDHFTHHNRQMAAASRKLLTAEGF